MRAAGALAARLRALLPTAAAEPWAARGAAAQLRRFAADGEPPADAAEAPAAAAAAAASAAAEASPPAAPAAPAAPARDERAELLAAGYTPRQAARLRRDPEAHRHFLPRLSRKERGSFADPEAAEGFAREAESYPRVPPDVPLYNLKEVVPEIAAPRCGLFDALQAAAAGAPGAPLEELAAAAGAPLPAGRPGPPAPGAQPILEWDLRLVLSPAAAGEAHPANKKARVRVALGALAAQCGLGAAGAARVAAVAGPRYDARAGALTLSCEAAEGREENRRALVRQLRDLVEDGRRADALAAAAGGRRRGAAGA
jgi:transcription termination factor Rho